MTGLTNSLRAVLLLFVCTATFGLNSAGAQTAPSDRLLVLLRDASALAIVDPANRTILGRVETARGHRLK